MLSVQLMLAAVGNTVGLVLVHAVSDSAGGVLTSKLTGVDTLELALEVTVKVPL